MPTPKLGLNYLVGNLKNITPSMGRGRATIDVGLRISEPQLKFNV